MLTHFEVMKILKKHGLTFDALHRKPDLNDEASVLQALRDASRLRGALRDIVLAAKPQ